MATRHRIFNVQQVRRRAEEIRREWSPLEKLRRTGLPPDMPPKLQQFFLGSPPRAWCMAADALSRRTGSRC